jgi:F0F1-type ATP synthase membrane subunit b/b'
MNDNFYAQLAIWSQIAGSIAFIAVLVWLWIKFLTPAVVASRDRKNAELAEAEKRRDTAAEEVQVAQRELATSGTEVDAIRARAVGDGAQYREHIVADAVSEGDRLVRNARGELARGRLAAREILRDELVAKALEIARGSARDLGPDTNRRLVGEAVESLERGGAA